MVTPADHANTVRDALLQHTEGYFDQQRDALAALDALTAQAETAEGCQGLYLQAMEGLKAAEAERDAAVQAAEQARNALRFYAIEGNNDKGRIARAALAGNQT